MAKKVQEVHDEKNHKCVEVLRHQIRRKRERAFEALAKQIMRKRGEYIPGDEW